MKNIFLILNLLLGVFAMGCSESAYTPSTGVPAYNTGMPGYNQGTTPYFNYQNQPMLNQSGVQMYQQGMLGWNMRMRMPGFYYNNYQYHSCIPQKPYTTSCTQTVTKQSCQTCGTRVVTTNTTNGDATTKVLPISWINEDAQALYQRLTREEQTKNGVKARTGDQYKCIVDGSERRAKNYVCDFEIRVKDGIILQQLPVGKPAQPEITTSTMYKGDLLNIGIPGQAAEVGYLTIAGPSASYLFQNFSVEAIQGKVEEIGNIDANIKTLGQVKCYQTLNTTNPVVECLIKIDSANGKALDF